MTAPEPGPLPDEAAEADALEQRVTATEADEVDDGPSAATGTDAAPLEANPADVAEQQQAVPLDPDDGPAADDL